METGDETNRIPKTLQPPHCYTDPTRDSYPPVQPLRSPFDFACASSLFGDRRLLAYPLDLVLYIKCFYEMVQ
jgi:hypothetical protein